MTSKANVDKTVTKPPCPSCDRPAAKKGKNAVGNQRYWCKTCRFSWVLDPIVGTKPRVLDRPLTVAEQSARHRAKLTPEQRAEKSRSAVERKRKSRLKSKHEKGSSYSKNTFSSPIDALD